MRPACRLNPNDRSRWQTKVASPVGQQLPKRAYRLCKLLKCFYCIPYLLGPSACLFRTAMSLFTSALGRGVSIGN
jgi:hypothetical protein